MHLFLHSHIYLYDVLRDKSSLYVTYIIVSGLQRVVVCLFQSQISSHYSPNKGLSIPNPQSLMFLPFLEQLRGLPPAPGGTSVNLPQLPHSTPPISKTVATSLASNVSTIPQLCDNIQCRCCTMSSPTLRSVAAGIVYSVSRVTTYWAARGSNPGGGEVFHAVPDIPRGPPSHLYSECCVSLPRVKQTVCGVDQAPLSSAEVVNGLSYTSNPPTSLHGLYWLTLYYDQNALLWIHTSATKIYSRMNLRFAILFCKSHAQT